LLVEAIKEQQIQINDLKNMIINNEVTEGSSGPADVVAPPAST
jgi:hypothetical protein